MRSCKRREKLRCDTSMVAGQGLGLRRPLRAWEFEEWVSPNYNGYC